MHRYTKEERRERDECFAELLRDGYSISFIAARLFIDERSVLKRRERLIARGVKVPELLKSEGGKLAPARLGNAARPVKCHI